MTNFNPDQLYHQTNPAAGICDHYGISMEDYFSRDWAVPYGHSIRHVIGNVCISLYRMDSGSYELTHYRTCG